MTVGRAAAPAPRLSLSRWATGVTESHRETGGCVAFGVGDAFEFIGKMKLGAA